MSLRDFNAPFPDDPRALQNAPMGNGTGLDNFHTRQPEDIEPNNTPKIIGAVAVALMIGTAGIAFYASSGSHPAQVKPVVASNLPAPPVTQPAPVAQETAAMTPDANTPATPAAAADNTPASPVKEASAPAPKKHKVASSESKSASTTASTNADSGVSARMAADSTQSTVQPQQQQAITAPAPAPSPSDVASNNTQSGVAVSPNATTASDIPAAQTNTAQNNAVAPQEAQPSTPQANSAPAPDQQGAATPAPAEPAGQVNQ